MLDGLKLYVVKSVSWQGVKLSDSVQSCLTRHPAVPLVTEDAVDEK